MPAGRPTDYDPECLELVRKVAKLGATDVEIADILGVTATTLYRWRHAHPEFCEALKLGKREADDRVEKSLYHRAVGYKHDAVKIFMPAGASEPVYAPYIEHFPPDTAAAFIWLKNRRPDEWRDRQEISGNITTTYIAEIPALAKSDDEWQQQHKPTLQ